MAAGIKAIELKQQALTLDEAVRADGLLPALSSNDIIESWRERLYDISWFMRGMNERIARMANEEEKL